MKQQLPAGRLHASLPDFLVIAPPKTGSTWLAANLMCHPEICMPDIKEVHFFSQFMGRRCWDWYAELFRSGRGLCKGEATPSYCDLPLERIRLVHSAMPRLKLIYLMRDPVARAWSYAKHCFRHRTGVFTGCTQSFEEIREEQWLACMNDAGCTRSSMYLQHLQSWRAVFPRSRFLVDFYASIKTEPVELLGRIFDFLGVKRPSSHALFPVSTMLNEGLNHPLPPSLRQYLFETHHAAIPELAEYLRTQFHLAIPASWPSNAAARSSQVRKPHDCEPAAPGRAIAAAQAPAAGLPAAIPSLLSYEEFEKRRLQVKYLPRIRAEDFYGFNIISFRDEFVAISRQLGAIDLRTLCPRDRRCFEQQELIFRGLSFEAVQAAVTAARLSAVRKQRS